MNEKTTTEKMKQAVREWMSTGDTLTVAERKELVQSITDYIRGRGISAHYDDAVDDQSLYH